MNERKRGISLLVLIITILVMIIIAGVVVVSLQKNNPIEKARRARTLTDMTSFMEEYNLTLVKLRKQGRIDKKTINAKTYSEIKKYIPSFTAKYEDVIVIKEGEFYFNTVIGNEMKISKELLEVGMKPLIYKLNEGGEFKFRTIQDGVVGLGIRDNLIYIVQGCKFNNVIFVPAESLPEASVSFNQPDAEAQNEMVFENCKFLGKFTLDSHNGFRRAKFINCEFEDVQIKPTVDKNLPNKKIEFINCKINTSNRDTIKFAPNSNSRGNLNLIFNKCQIVNKGRNSFINLDAIPTSGQIEFINSSISMEGTLIGGYSSRLANQAVFNIKLKNSGKIPPVPSDLPNVKIVNM